MSFSTGAGPSGAPAEARAAGVPGYRPDRRGHRAHARAVARPGIPGATAALAPGHAAAQSPGHARRGDRWQTGQRPRQRRGGGRGEAQRENQAKAGAGEDAEQRGEGRRGRQDRRLEAAAG